jgi:hypothetical protein
MQAIMEQLPDLWCLWGTQEKVCLKSEVWAAWVQSVGSLIAIVVAILLGWWQRKGSMLNCARTCMLRARELRTSMCLRNAAFG